MKHLVNCKKLLIVAFLLPLIQFPYLLKSQTSYKSNTVTTVIIGDSNIHEWEMNSSKGTANASVTVNAEGMPVELKSIQFTLAAETLKSGKSQMDKNTYKALNTSSYPNITFSGTNGTVQNNGSKKFTIHSKGKLTISGVSKDVELVVNGEVNADKSLNLNGSYSFKMTEYKVTPPSIMLGTIKVYDPLTIKYSLTVKP